MEDFKICTTAKRIVVKVGTSTLTHANGRLHLQRMESLARPLTDLRNGGREVVLVSSGAVGAGLGRLGLEEKNHAGTAGRCRRGPRPAHAGLFQTVL